MMKELLITSISLLCLTQASFAEHKSTTYRSFSGGGQGSKTQAMHIKKADHAELDKTSSDSELKARISTKSLEESTSELVSTPSKKRHFVTSYAGGGSAASRTRSINKR